MKRLMVFIFIIILIFSMSCSTLVNGKSFKEYERVEKTITVIGTIEVLVATSIVYSWFYTLDEEKDYLVLIFY